MNAQKFTFPKDWIYKPYFSLDAYLKQSFGEKVYKIALDASLSCPNRDGTIGTNGCIFCSQGGSGDFAIRIASPQNGIFPDASLLLETAFSKHSGSPFIAYFQAFTNTYGELSYLEKIYRFALSFPEVIGLSIGTRPDCITPAILSLLADLQREYPSKFIWIELGLQTIKESTATYIRRGYPLDTFELAFRYLSQIDIPVIVHVILGLPGEQATDMLQTIQYLDKLHPFGIKLQLLHVLEHTDLALDYQAGKFDVLSLDEYITLLAQALTHLSPDIVIHRVTGDGPKSITIAPTWSFDKKNVLNTLHKYMRENRLLQGCMIPIQ